MGTLKEFMGGVKSMNKEYYISKAEMALKQAEMDLKAIKFIIDNNIDGYILIRDRRAGGDIIKLYRGDYKVSAFSGDYSHLTILNKLTNKSETAGLNSEELKACCKTLAMSKGWKV